MVETLKKILLAGAVAVGLGLGGIVVSAIGAIPIRSEVVQGKVTHESQEYNFKFSKNKSLITEYPGQHHNYWQKGKNHR